MSPATTLQISYWLAVLALSSVLIWGLKLLSRELQKQDGQNRTRFASALTEKDDANPAVDEKTSFSRVAGSIGAIGLAASFTGIGYWVLHQLFFESDLSKLSGLGPYLLAGSSLFVPYAFNKLSLVFK